MVGIELTADDREILVEARNLYLFDWREEDADEETAGWRNPSYFSKSYNFRGLVDVGLMEYKSESPFKPTAYRISKLGMHKVSELEAPVATPAAAVDSGTDVSDADLFLQSLAQRDAEVVHLEHEVMATRASLAMMERKLAAAEEALRRCINADVVGYWSAEEVAQRYFAAQEKASDSP